MMNIKLYLKPFVANSMQKKNITKQKEAFTLIELLVVIAIIAILAALLFPTLRLARQRAKDIMCLSNKKQIVLGISTYGNDYNLFTPYNIAKGHSLYKTATSANAGLGIPAFSTQFTGMGKLYSLNYAKNGDIFWCSNEDKPKKETGSKHYKYGLKGFLQNPPSGSIETTVWYRCGWYYDNNPSEKLINIRQPLDGMAMCAATGWSNRLSWEEIHQGRGFALAMVDGSGVWAQYSATIPTPPFWTTDTHYRPDKMKKALTQASTYFRSGN